MSARPDRDMTTGEAEAWRRGWEAAREGAAKAVTGHDRTGRDWVPGSLWDSLTRQCADRIRAMEAPHD
jgi:hypothetical protein